MGRIIFTDFDGTITRVDTCFAMVKTFASDIKICEKIDKLWQEKQISTEECANRIFQLFRANPSDLKKFLETIEIDSYFKEFLRLANINGDKVIVLSDGYDFNIRTIFEMYDINLPFYANKLRYDENDGTFRIECENHNQSCGNCGTCKTNLISMIKNDGDGDDNEIVYIGDGRSDFCPAKHADIVFAKNTLLKYCVENGVSATPFEHFGDIIRELNYFPHGD